MSTLHSSHICQLLILSTVAFGCSSCGSKGGAGSASGSNPIVTSITVTASATSITTAQTATCTAAVSGTNTSQAVTWSASGPGTITQAGVVTPTGAGTITCTATSTQDATKSGSATVTVTSPPTVSLVANPATIIVGQSTTLTVTSNGSTCSIPGISGVGCNSTVSVRPTTTTTYTVTANGVGGSSTAQATVTVNPVQYSISCAPNVLTTADTAQCTATPQNFGSGVTWSVNSGSIDAAGVFTPPGTVTGSVTVTITGKGFQDPTISASTTVSVTQAVPVITSIGLPPFYCDAECFFIGGVQVHGSGFQASDTISSVPSGLIYGSQLVSSTSADLTLAFDTRHNSPGWITISICLADGSHCSSGYAAFLGNQDSLAVAANGELFYEDPLNSNTWKYLSDGTPDGGLSFAGYGGIAVDDKTGEVLQTQKNGNATLDISGGLVASYSTGQYGLGAGAQNGTGCFTSIGLNILSCIDLTKLNYLSPAPLNNSAPFGSQPWSFDLAVSSSGETDAFILTRDGTPTLWKFNVSGGIPTLLNSQPIPGITPVATLAANNALSGGWQVIAFDAPRITVTEKSNADSTKFVNAPIKIGAPTSNVAVGIGPSLISNPAGFVGTTQQFSATVSGSLNQQVTWLVNGAPNGNSAVGFILNSSGLYQYPSTPMPFVTLTATSVADPAKSANAYVIGGDTSVYAALSPTSASLGPNQTVQFTPIVSNPVSADTTVNWYVNGIQGGNAGVGTISTSGLYTAPQAAPTSAAVGTVAVLSVADKLLTFLRSDTLAITKQITLSGIPFRIAKDLTNGNDIVAFVDQANIRTTFASVNAATGVITPLISTTPVGVLAVGFRVSADGKNLYACQRAQCIVLPNN